MGVRVGETRQPLSMEIRLLGLVEASQDGHTVPLGGAKPRALLAILALQANTPVSADRLIGDMDSLYRELLSGRGP